MLWAADEVDHLIDEVRLLEKEKSRLLGELSEMERQRDKATMLTGELVAIIRVNAMRGTWAEATPEQVDEFLVPWIAKLRLA